MNNARSQQEATQTLFKAISKHDTDVPIIVVVTKMDEFQAIQGAEAREEYGPAIDNREELEQKCQEYVVEQVQNRTDLIEGEMGEVEGGHVEACVSVARSTSRFE